ncbi:MAG: hypothetical protein ABFS35_12325 [Bacteroidota bacterium]
MHTEILSKYSLWYIFLLLLFSAFISWYLYRKDEKFIDLEKRKIYTLVVTRFLSVFFISLFLLSIVLRYVRLKIEKPIIIVAHDNSESIKLVLDNKKIEEDGYKYKFDDFIKKISNEYHVKILSFGDKLGDSIPYSFDEKETNFTDLFKNIEQQYINYNVGALLIASDGIYNQGINPIHLAKKLPYPIYTIALGDSSQKKDIFLRDVLNNSIAFLGDEFPLEIHLSAFGFKDDKINLRISNSGKTIIEQKINITGTDFFKKLHFDLKAEQKGLQHYKIEILSKDDEFTKANNYKNFAIDIIDDKKKVLILANSVHPDISAIREALKINKNLIVDFFTIDQFKKIIEDYQLVIFHQIPSYRYNVQNQFLRLKKAKIPALFILGSQSNVNSLNDLNTGINVLKNHRAIEFTEARFNNQFNLFETEHIKKSNFDDYPPLISPFGEYILNKKSDILLYQEIKGIKTEKPLIFLFSEDDPSTGKFGFICGEGIWRWRINDYLENGNHEQFDALVDRLVHYLSLDIKKERFIVYSKRIFNENELINFRADFYNQSYELTNESEVLFEITNEENKKFNYIFSRTNGSYALDAGQLPVGKYNYKAKITEAGKMFSKSGEFVVVPLNVEAVNTRANYQMLYQLAKENGGLMFSPDSLENLLSELKLNSNIRPVSFSTKDLIDLIELRWLFFIIIGLLSAEWFLRKFFGSY